MSERAQESFLVRNAAKVAIGSLTLVTMLVIGIFSHQTRQRDEAAQWVSHTYEVIGYIEQLSNNLKEAALGHRGYLITNDPLRLDPYTKALTDTPEYDAGIRGLQQQRSIRQQLALLKKLTADNPVQKANLAELEGATAKFLAYLDESIKQRREGNIRMATAPESLAQGSRLLDDIRTLVRVMKTEETNLLALRFETASVSGTMNERLTLGGILLFYLCLVAAVVLYLRNRETAMRDNARYTAELEKREEELKMQQEELKASNEEIEASNEELEEKTNALEEQNARIRKTTAELEEAKSQLETKAGELERASKYKSEFLANMSHELRTPLNSLLILAKSFAGNEEGNLTPEQIEEARVIHAGGMELLNLINDILDLSKVEAGKLNVVNDTVYVADIVKRMTQSFEPVAKEKGLSLKIRVDDGLPQTVQTDAQRLDQVLKNLLSNAFKFTEKGSVTLDIHAPSSTVEMQRVGSLGMGAVAFSVIDTGIGIEESKFRDIFEAFQQEDGSTERHYGGTGLGLTIARKFAHMLGGEIHVASAKGKGSTFTLFLPLNGGQVARADDKSLVPPAKAPLAPAADDIKETARFIADDRRSVVANDKVMLIIEDDPHFAGTIMKIARQRGYKCVAAGDGKSGVVLASEYPVTAIVLDLKLPDIDGMNVLDQLKSSLKTRHIPVHIISGMKESPAVVPLRKGAVGYLTKPVTVEDVDEAFARMENMSRPGMKKILVVEDEVKTQTAIQKLLRQKDVDITITGSGKDGLKKIASENYDCVILDLKLSDMTGFEFLESLGDEQKTPVIIYTARELTEDENRELTRYTDSIVIKGVSSSERLLDEVTLFLHSVESKLSEDQKAMIRMNHDPDRVLQNRTVMLVDDDMRNTFALSKILKKHGMNVVIADNGQMAIDKLVEEPGIELVIMDIMMPVMDGYQAMRIIRTRNEWVRLPIIALTARAMPEEQENCMAAGANDYLTKPVDIDRLLTLLRVWLFRQEKAA